jgi:hypothetical protein
MAADARGRDRVPGRVCQREDRPHRTGMDTVPITTDQKVGGSNPSERAKPPGQAACPESSQRSSELLHGLNGWPSSGVVAGCGLHACDVDDDEFAVVGQCWVAAGVGQVVVATDHDLVARDEVNGLDGLAHHPERVA